MPRVTYIPPRTAMLPPPRSVATAALLAPEVVTSRLDALILPPPADMIPCAYCTRRRNRGSGNEDRRAGPVGEHTVRTVTDGCDRSTDLGDV